MYQDMHNRAKMKIKKDICMEFYNASWPLYLETDASGIGLGTRLLQLRDGLSCGHNDTTDNIIPHPIAFASKGLLNVECHYSNIE